MVDPQTPWGVIIYNTQGYIMYLAGAECLLSFSCYRGYRGLQFKTPYLPPPNLFPICWWGLNWTQKKKDTRVIIFINSVHGEIFICVDVMSQSICQFMFIIPGGCERWRSFLHWKVQLSVIFRGSFYYSLCCMMKNWSWNQKKNIYTEWFSCNSLENWWNLRIGYVYIVNKKEWQQWWMIIVCSV